MIGVLKELLAWLVPAITSRARKLVKVSAEDLRSIARGVVGDGKGSWGQMFAEARKRVSDLGAALDDDMDVRIGDALQAELASLHMPADLAKVADKAEDIEREWERAEQRGLERGRETARTLDPDNTDEE